ncbi:hypothetical protein B1F68_00025, partial [Pseudomonas syringae]
MAGSPRHELDESTDHRAHPAAAADRRADALAGRKAPAAQGSYQSVFQHLRAGYFRGAVPLGTT